MLSKIRHLIFSNRTNRQILVKNTFWLGLIEFFSKIIMFFVTVWLVRYLGPSLFGKYNTALSLVAVFMIFSDLGVGFTMTRDIAKDKSLSSNYLAQTFSLRLFTSLFIITISLIASYFLRLDLDLLIIFILAIIHNLSLQFQGLFNNVFIAYEKMEYLFIVRTSYYLGLLLTTFLSVANHFSLTTIISIYCSVTIITLIIALYLISLLKIRLTISFDFLFWKKIVLSSLPIFGYIACSQIYSNLDTILISRYYDHVSVGLYQSAYKILFAFQSVNIINSALFPRLISLIHQRQYSTLKKTLLWTVTFSLVSLILLALIISLLSRQIILFIYGPEYISASIILIFLIFSGVVNFFKVLSINFLMAQNCQSKILISSFIGLVINGVLNILLLPIYGVQIAALNLLISEIIILVITLKFQPKLFVSRQH